MYTGNLYYCAICCICGYIRSVFMTLHAYLGNFLFYALCLALPVPVGEMAS